MDYIRVWCEYDFGGEFGGNNNEAVFTVSSDTPVAEIDRIVEERLKSITCLSAEDLEGLYDWAYIEVEVLG